MTPPSGDCRGSRAKVGGGGCKIRELRRVDWGGSNVGTSEVIGEGGCEIREFRRGKGGGSNFGTIEVVRGGGCENRRRVKRGGSNKRTSLDLLLHSSLLAFVTL